ncbi:MAG: M23 family metallopeptidase [Gemmatimonadota bacterium]
MSSRNPRRWTVLLMREGATRSRSFEISPLRIGLASATVLLVLGALFAAMGRWLEKRAEREQARLQEARITALTEQNAKVLALSGQLDSLEVVYRRLENLLGVGRLEGERESRPPSPGARERDARTPAAAADPGAPTAWPLVQDGFVTRTFGDSADGASGAHEGMDIAIPIGSYVRASGGGVVVEAGSDEVYGRYIRIDHGGGVSSLYAHNSWLFRARGDTVERGEIIALSGDTGRSTAPHLHLEVDRDGSPVDPLDYLGRGR